MKRPGVFLSHNRHDKAIVRRLAKDLERAGARVWVDEAMIEVGDSLIEKIRQGIDEMDFLAVILSSHSVSSEWVRKEVDIAMTLEIENGKVKVLPLLMEPCELPGFLKGKLYADFTIQENYEAALSLVLRKLGLRTIFETALFEECVACLTADTDMHAAMQKHSELNAYALGDWLLERLWPRDNIRADKMYLYWDRLRLLSRVVREMGSLSPLATEFRDMLVALSADDFEYDWEFNDNIEYRRNAIHRSLQTIGDDMSLSTISRRWPDRKGVKY